MTISQGAVPEGGRDLGSLPFTPELIHERSTVRSRAQAHLIALPFLALGGALKIAAAFRDGLERGLHVAGISAAVLGGGAALIFVLLLLLNRPARRAVEAVRERGDRSFVVGAERSATLWRDLLAAEPDVLVRLNRAAAAQRRRPRTTAGGPVYLIVAISADSLDLLYLARDPMVVMSWPRSAIETVEVTAVTAFATRGPGVTVRAGSVEIGFRPRSGTMFLPERGSRLAKTAAMIAGATSSSADQRTG